MRELKVHTQKWFALREQAMNSFEELFIAHFWKFDDQNNRNR